jgi:hypothetical protein
MVDDYKVHLYPEKPDPKKLPVDVIVRAQSADDAKRQAKAQYPGYRITASPVKLPSKK